VRSRERSRAREGRRDPRPWWLEALRFEDKAPTEPALTRSACACAAVGVNSLDTWVRRGVPGHEFPLPLVPG
jgi:NADPH:quinone reductase-like Zn-dependent oxidoreductase